MIVSDRNGTVPEGLDVDLSKLEKESNTRNYSGFMKHFVTLYLLCFTLFQLYTSVVGTVPPQIIRMVHLGFAIPLSYLLYPATSKGSTNRLHPLDLLLSITFLLVAGYYLYNYDALIERVGFYTILDIIVGAAGMILVLEACRRVVGWPIVIIAVVFILYASYGKYMPGFLNHRGYSIRRIVSQLFFSTEGVIGSPLGVCASFVFLFILFGAFLEKTGIGQFFTDIANALAGSVPGGPAKVAVITSALQGTVSGSSVSNTVSTGSFTIPLMKSLGYRPEFAAAVEAAASTGGQIMPPIMGAAAFLISEIVGVSYIEVVKAAAIPAMLYFSGIWIMVHLEAKKRGLRGLPKGQVPHAGQLLKKEGHLILPLVAIMAFLIMGFTTTRAALWGILTAVVVPYLRKSTRVPAAEIASALIVGAKNILGVSCACSTAGIIVGVVTMTGIGLKLGEGLTTLTSGTVIPTLFFTMITSLVLGMGVPTTANYLITATIAAPIVVRLGIPVLAAHLFSFYFGILSDVTPPVALAAYAGSAIAKSNPFKTGVIATKLAVAAFLVPYMFALNPSLILIDMNNVRQLALECLPQVIVCGTSSYPRLIDFKAFADIAHEVSAYLWCDCAHTIGLIAAGANPSPVPYADVVTFSTQKTLRGPRGCGVILCKEELGNKIDRGVFPRIQGGPKGDMLAARGVLFKECMTPEFKAYGAQVVKNAQALARGCADEGLALITGGTDTHMVMIDVTPLIADGQEAEILLNSVGMVTNKNAIPFDKLPPSIGSGLRIGSPTMTTRGAKEKEMYHIGRLLGQTLKNKTAPEKLKEIAAEVRNIAESHPMFSDEWIPAICREQQSPFPA